MLIDSLYSQVKLLPRDPGVYIYKDNTNEIIYIGKANNVRNRVLQYFTAIDKHPLKTRQLVDRICSIEFIITDSELQALILESNLIKKHKPRYNIRLKDDKNYPYIKITTKENWPTVSIVRRFYNDGSRYFGPFANAGNVKNTLRVIERIFPYRTCRNMRAVLSKKPCLKYHIGRCSGPCIGAINETDYTEMIRNIISLLDGKQESIIKNLQQKMNYFANAQDYEKAAVIRDQIEAIKDVINSQRISLPLTGDKDAIAFMRKDNIAFAEIFFVRGGKVMGHNQLIIEGVKGELPERIMSEVLKQYYLLAANIPQQIILQYPPLDKKVLSDWLMHLRSGPVKLITPLKGKNKQLIDIVTQNAVKGMEFNRLVKYTEVDYSLIAEEMKNALKLSNTPYRIEGYDISDIAGEFAVGCLVAFEKGKPRKDLYRRFKIRHVEGIDDYSMMKEILKKRFNKYTSGDKKWSLIPDLIIIDGGKGHLNMAIKTLHDLNINYIDVISLAKEHEQIFIARQNQPITLEYSSPLLHLLQRIRDEVHRYAISYHKRIRDKKIYASALDDIPGIGENRKKALLKTLGSLAKIKNAKIEDLSSIKGINKKLAEIILQHLN